ncbi:MAG: DUF4981 domain-containing protein [Propionibacteriaceae bacterium]|jgi:beta-galactosidase|nr:DUF4981 domain-containing protein [Propionibacteriaceae bacterium]
MSFDYSKLGDPGYFNDGRAAAHSDHTAGKRISLDGLWKFHFCATVAGRPLGFEEPGFDVELWDDIRVPRHIQLAGYDTPQYCNVEYPWDGLEQIEPGQVPEHNPVGSYVRFFTWDSAPGKVSLVFEGAESALAVWLNGQYVGYSTDSFTPSEFDVTDFLLDGTNRLAVQVFKFSSGSWLEDQDMFRFSGLFRSVYLLAAPRAHLEDVGVSYELNDDFTEARVKVSCALSAGSVKAYLGGVEVAQGSAELEFCVLDPELWSAERPYLHELRLEVFDGGELCESTVIPIGFRRVAIEDGVLKLNGQRLVFKGVNRHEFGAEGRVMSYEQTEADIQLLKRLNVNAVRTCHYPNNSFLYDLCDRYGLYVVDEVNLETHGLWGEIEAGLRDVEHAIPGGDPAWRDAVFDRANSMYMRDRNHASVIMWSLGNESFGGTTLRDLHAWFKGVDPSRPVQYEGVWHDQRYLETSDFYSLMYYPVREVREFMETRRDKPWLMIEYAHSMGNSFGAVDEYMDLAYQEDLFQGGFIWDFADQALQLRDPQGETYFGYGGDFGDRPHDSDFSGDGICFADHTPKPACQEVKRVYQPIEVEVLRDSVHIENRSLFTPTSQYRCVVSVSSAGRSEFSVDLDTNVAPGERASYPLPDAVAGLLDDGEERVVDVSFRLRSAQEWAEAGWEVAFGQGVFGSQFPQIRPRTRSGAEPNTHPTQAPKLVTGTFNVGVSGPHFSVLFSKLQGGLVSYKWAGRELLKNVPKPCFWHAPTSNERGWDMPFADGQWQLASRYAKAEFAGVTQDECSTTVAFDYKFPAGGHCLVSYSVFADGYVEALLKLEPWQDAADPPEFALLLETDPTLQHLRWYGDGPEETYLDRRKGAKLAVYEAEVGQQLSRYLRPQEAGNHTGVRWASVTDESGLGLRFEAIDAPIEFSALPWTPWEIEAADHPNELPLTRHTVLRPAYKRRGVAGDDTWGAKTHEQYRVPAGPLVFRLGFNGVA